METFSALLAICAGNSPVPGEFPTQWPVTQSFDVYFDLRLNKRLCKQPWGWWFETLLCPLWRHSNDYREKLWNIWNAQWKHSYLTFPVAGNGLASTTKICCHFNGTLTCNVMGENAIWNIRNSRYTIGCTRKYNFYIIRLKFLTRVVHTWNWNEVPNSSWH